jgi:PmbA protein
MNDILARTGEVMRKAVALGADEAIARTIFGRYRQVRFSNNQVDTSVGWNSYFTDVTLAWKKRVVSTQIRDFVDVDASLKMLMDLAKVTKENPTFAGFAKGKFKYRKGSGDERLRELEKPTDYVFEAVEAARKEAGKSAECGGVLFSKFEDVFLVSSRGPVGTDCRSAVQLSIRAFSEREASGHGVECCSSLKGFDPAGAGEKAGEVAWLARKPVSGEEGAFDVVFDPLIFGNLLTVWGAMASAFNVMTRQSAFVDKLGKKVAPENVTLRDNPASYSIGNRVFDDEGVPTKENVIVDKGLLKTYLHNTSTGKLFKTKTSGNAGLVTPTPWNVELDAGDMSREEVFGEVKNGLFLTNSWYTRFQNYAKGDFSTIPRDGIFLLKNGEVKRSLKDIRVSDNVLGLLGRIAAVSKERQHLQWWIEVEPCLSPYVLVKDVHITKSR